MESDWCPMRRSIPYPGLTGVGKRGHGDGKMGGEVREFFVFFNCMFYQLLCVQHSRSSTQSLDSVLPSIVETRDQNSRGCPLLFSYRNLGSFCAYSGQKSYTPTAFGKLSTTPGVRCMKHASS